MFKWNQAFNFGDEQIDEQRKHFVCITTPFLRQSSANIDPEIISELLTKLTAFATSTQPAEIIRLTQLGCMIPDIHKEEHREKLLKISYFCNDIMHHKSNTNSELQAFLLDWWENHFLGTDMVCRQCLRDCASNDGTCPLAERA